MTAIILTRDTGIALPHDIRQMVKGRKWASRSFPRKSKCHRLISTSLNCPIKKGKEEGSTKYRKKGEYSMESKQRGTTAEKGRQKLIIARTAVSKATAARATSEKKNDSHRETYNSASSFSLCVSQVVGCFEPPLSSKWSASVTDSGKRQLLHQQRSSTLSTFFCR